MSNILKQQIEIFTALADGKTIEYSNKFRNDGWIIKDKYACWDFHNYIYRVKSIKIKMWQWLFKNNIGQIGVTSTFYTNPIEAQQGLYKNNYILYKAEWTEIEVDG